MSTYSCVRALRSTPPELAPELAVFALDGEVEIDGETLAGQTLAVLASKPAQIRATIAMRLMLIGGDALGEKRFMWWILVSSYRARIEEAAQAWAGQRMGQVLGETELIALPERGA